jgi:hypothetical protein
MRNLLALSLLALVVLTVSRSARAESPQPVRVAVFPMSSDVADVRPELLEAAVTDALVRVGRFEVVARTQIDAVLREQRVANSDLVDPKTAAAAGRLLGATYVATGRLLAANFEPGFFSKDEFRARAQLQLLEVETGRIVLSETFVGVRSQLVMRRGETLSKLSPAEREKRLTESVASIAAQFADRVNLLRPLEGYVVKADGARVAINLGDGTGVKVGQEFLVYEEDEPIRDPATGEQLSVERHARGRLVVTAVEKRLSWTELLVTSSPAAKATVAGEVVDLYPVKGVVREQMSIVQTAARAAEIREALARARRRR